MVEFDKNRVCRYQRVREAEKGPVTNKIIRVISRLRNLSNLINLSILSNLNNLSNLIILIILSNLIILINLSNPINLINLRQRWPPCEGRAGRGVHFGKRCIFAGSLCGHGEASSAF